jgi:NCS1 family nucleobase:cation symporter-1
VTYEAYAVSREQSNYQYLWIKIFYAASFVVVSQWLSSIAWDGLVGLFGADALAVLVDIPFWVAVLIVLSVQGVVGFFGYEVIHRLQPVLTVVLFVTFVVFAVKLVGGHEIVTPAAVQGPDLVGAFVLEVTVALSLAISWASYALDFSRYLPANSSQPKVFGFTFAGIVSAYVFVQGIGVAAAPALSEQTSEGVRSVMGGGVLGLALLVIAGGSRVRGDERLQRFARATDRRRPAATAGVGVGRHRACLRVDSVAALPALRRHVVAVPGCVAAGQLLDSRLRGGHGCRLVDPCAFVVAYGAAVPFMHTTLIEGPIARA